MKYKKITAREAYKLMDRLGLDYGDDGVTFYATDMEETCVHEFYSRKKRDDFVAKSEARDEEEKIDNEWNMENGDRITNVTMDGKPYASVWDAIKAMNGIK